MPSGSFHWGRVLLISAIGVAVVVFGLFLSQRGNAAGDAIVDLFIIALRIAVVVAIVGGIIWIIRRGVAQGVRDAQQPSSMSGTTSPRPAPPGGVRAKSLNFP